MKFGTSGRLAAAGDDLALAQPSEPLGLLSSDRKC